MPAAAVVTSSPLTSANVTETKYLIIAGPVTWSDHVMPAGQQLCNVVVW